MQVITILGSNSGNKAYWIEEAAKRLAIRAGQITARSSFYETEPWGFESPENFLNQVIVYETFLSPEAFLQHALETERDLGRVRLSGAPRYTSRNIDIDLLFYDSLVLDLPALTLPHPRLTERRFVLEPLLEILPDWVHPTLKRTIRELYAACPDTSDVKRITIPVSGLSRSV